MDSSEQCEPCDIGRYSANSNVDRQCKLCDAGKFQTETGASSCRKCAKGKTSDSDGLGMGCEPCKTGRYTDTLGMPVCAVCNAGKYADILGSHECKVCPENTYRLKPEAKDQRECLMCQDNAETLRSTQTSGAYLKTHCICSTGYYAYGTQGNDELDPLLECKTCPKGAKCTATSTGHVLDADIGYWTPNATTTHPEKRFYRCLSGWLFRW